MKRIFIATMGAYAAVHLGSCAPNSTLKERVELPEVYMTKQYEWAMKGKDAHERADRLEALWHEHLPMENGGENPMVNGYEDGTHIFTITGCAWQLCRAYIESGQDEKALKILNWLAEYESRLQLGPVIPEEPTEEP